MAGGVFLDDDDAVRRLYLRGLAGLKLVAGFRLRRGGDGIQFGLRPGRRLAASPATAGTPAASG